MHTRSSNVSPYELATLYASLGDNRRAFEWLDAAYRERNLGLMRLNTDFMLDPVRSDPRLPSWCERLVYRNSEIEGAGELATKFTDGGSFRPEIYLLT